MSGSLQPVRCSHGHTTSGRSRLIRSRTDRCPLLWHEGIGFAVLHTLRAASAIETPKTIFQSAQRWVPWLCAYSGARPGEITQLRGVDIQKRGHVPVMALTPEAGTIKTGKPRTVPLHAHLIQQGFLDFVRARGKRFLFYDPPKRKGSSDPTNPKRSRSVSVRQRLAAWVRKLGVTDKELKPNHAWRHTFKQIADRANISERTSDYITGHAHRTGGAKYGAPTVDDMGCQGCRPTWATSAT